MRSPAVQSDAPQRQPVAPVRRFDKNFVKWIPVVVPAFAVLLALCTYYIVGTVV
jgi:hypothetical protein